MSKNIGFRAWFYFRQGWATYFAFIFAAVNTLTVTYYLAIENYPALKTIFPSFLYYVIIVTSIGIPALILVGYAHFKKTPSYRSETDITMEADPYRRRMVVNGEVSVRLNIKITEMLLKLMQNEKLTEAEIDDIKKLNSTLSDLVKERTFANKKDLTFYQNLDKK